MPIYCDESGGVGRGVMTLAALSIDAEAADEVLAGFRETTGLRGELKGSRIDLTERAQLFQLLEAQRWHATVGVAVSALTPARDEDRGDHDIEVYAELLNDVVAAMLPDAAGGLQVIIDDGRYGPATLALVRNSVGRLVGPLGSASLAISDTLAGLQLADVIANTFFNRAMPTERQGQMAGIVAPFLERGQIKLNILTGDPERHNQSGE